MGWWKISGPAGGIDWTHNASTGCVTAIPGKDSTENYYNGDGPADEMTQLLDFLAKRVGKRFVRKIVVGGKSTPEIEKAVKSTWERIELLCVEAFGRQPYPEEREAIINFCL